MPSIILEKSVEREIIVQDLIMQFTHPGRFKALCERRFYKELDDFPKTLDVFVYACIKYDSTTLDELAV